MSRAALRPWEIREIWDVVVEGFRSLDLWNASGTVLNKIRSRQKKCHGRAWATIFKDQKWLDMAKEFGARPVLLGKDLDQYYSGHRRSGSNYLVLAAEDRSGDLRYHEEDFFASLHQDRRKCGSYEIYFPSSDVVLNVYDILVSDYKVEIDPPRFFHGERARNLRTRCVCWCDPTHKLLNVSRRNMVGPWKLGYGQEGRHQVLNRGHPEFCCEMQLNPSQGSEYHIMVFNEKRKHLEFLKRT